MSHESYILPENPFLSISNSEKRVSNKLKNHMLETPNTRVMKNKTRKISAILFTLVYFKESSQICSYFMRYLIEMKANLWLRPAALLKINSYTGMFQRF